MDAKTDRELIELAAKPNKAMTAIKVHQSGWTGWVSAIDRYGNVWALEGNRKFALALNERETKRVIAYCKSLGWDYDWYEHSDDWHSRLSETERFVWEETKRDARSK